MKIDPKTRRDVAGLADPDAAVRLRPRRRRQDGLRRLDVLDLLQLRARHRQARGDRRPSATATTSPPSTGRPPRRPIAEGKGDMIGGVKVLDPKKVPGHRLPDALRQVAPRRRRLARRQVHHRLRQAPGRHDRLQLREGPDRDPQQGLHGRRGRHPGPQVRVDQGRRGPGRASARCTPSSGPTATPTPRSSSTARSPSGSSAPGRSWTRSRCPTRSAT